MTMKPHKVNMSNGKPEELIQPPETVKFWFYDSVNVGSVQAESIPKSLPIIKELIGCKRGPIYVSKTSELVPNLFIWEHDTALNSTLEFFDDAGRIYHLRDLIDQTEHSLKPHKYYYE